MESWYLFISGQQAGPFTAEQVADLAQAGKLPADAMAFDQAGQQWVALAQVPALAALAPAAYFCHRNNEQSGPFTIAQLKAQLAAGTLAAGDLVFITASNDWQPLQTSPLWPQLTPAAQPAVTAKTTPAIKVAAIPLKRAAAESAGAAVASVKPAATAAQDEPAAVKPVPTATEPIQFPCRNHPDRESFLICRACGADFCENCLVEIAGTRYCKECQAAGKAAPAEKKASKLIGNLFNKK